VVLVGKRRLRVLVEQAEAVAVAVLNHGYLYQRFYCLMFYISKLVRAD
jgi:hypothetical protein